jgi:hypothetical protein
MGLLDQIIGRLGSQEPLERLSREEADFDDPQSPDSAHWNELVGAAPPEEVASLAAYLRQHHPEAFGPAAAQLGREEPGLLQQLLGNKFLLLAAAGLAGRFLADRPRGR